MSLYEWITIVVSIVALIVAVLAWLVPPDNVWRPFLRWRKWIGLAALTLLLLALGFNAPAHLISPTSSQPLNLRITVDESQHADIKGRAIGPGDLSGTAYFAGVKHWYVAIGDFEPMSGTLEVGNIGGLLVVILLNQYKNEHLGPNSQWLVRPLKDLDLRIDRDPNSLPNLVIKGELSIEHVLLKTDDKQFFVVFDIKSLTDAPVSVVLRRGQVFEQTNKADKVQSLAISKDYKINLQPQKWEQIKCEAFCLNKNWSPPRNVPGRLTIVTIADLSFRNQQDLWAELGQH